MKVNLKAKPFYLSDEDIKWVENTIQNMTEDEKIGQLFCLVGYKEDEDYFMDILNKYKPAGLMCRPMPVESITNIVKLLQKNSKIPMLIPANLEKGANGIIEEGTFFGSPMQVAATDDEEMAYRMGLICGREAAAVGGNWSFAPIIDIDYNFRNPITNTRTFGSNPECVKKMGVNYVKGLQENGLAASIKHFPGDGVDERDQHLVTTVNSLSCEEWDATYGEAYKACIEAGAMTVMVGHIMQPAYSKKLNPSLEDKDILPATLSYELVTKLLKEKLGFNGMVVTDAATMAGMEIPMSRAELVPSCIEAGCDMFLFAKNLEEDFGYMKDGVKNGIITQERLHEALTKVLGLKAALKLHKKSLEELAPTLESAIPKIGTEEHLAWAKECADKSVTLVKEDKDILPINPSKYKKVLFYDIQSAVGNTFYTVKEGVDKKFKKLLEKEGFEVDQFVPAQGNEGMMRDSKEITEKYDLIIYLANMATKSNQTTVRIEWAQPMGANVPIYVNVVPTIFISVENPYHLLDVPRVKNFINAYSSTDVVLEALIEKLVGRSEFKGISPVDAFCGMWDTKL